MLTLGGENGARPCIFVQRYDAERPMELRTHIHQFLEIVFIEGGSGSHIVDGEELDVDAGDVFLIEAGSIHDPRGLSRTTRWILAFNPESVAFGHAGRAEDTMLRPFGGSEGRRYQRLHLSQAERAAFATRLDALKRELSDRTVGYEHAARALLSLLLVDAARGKLHDGPAARPPNGPIVEGALAFIEARFRDPIGLRDVARATGRSPGYLTDLLRRRTGRTVMQWITERRIEEARHLLLSSPHLRIEEVADAVGYADPGHFHRTFRARVGMPPGEFRSKHGL